MLEEEVNIVGVKEWSFLFRNFVKVGEKRGFRSEFELVVGRR